MIANPLGRLTEDRRLTDYTNPIFLFFEVISFVAVL